MARKKKEQVQVKPIQTIDTTMLMTEYKNLLDTDPQYSLEVDPENKYNMSESQKAFISAYCQYKNIPLAASIAGIDPDVATGIFISLSSQNEIRRINKAMYARQFTTKMLTIEEIGGWLSSLIIDENVPYADRLKTTDKLHVAKMLLDLNAYQKDSLINPANVVTKDIESQIKDLSLETIKQLVSADDSLQSKRELITKLNSDKTLTMEDVAYLETLSYDELLKLIEKVNSHKEN